MKKMVRFKYITVVVLYLVVIFSCGHQGKNEYQGASLVNSDTSMLLPGADQLDRYMPLLEGKKVGLMGNQTSVIGDRHLVDVLLDEGVDLKFVFAPEHGFRGDIERGENVSNELDERTGLPLYSLYGKNEKADSIVASVDVMIFDLQDVGARFYTYITSMHQIMQLCANQGKKLIILDRPNPNGDQVDGPVRKDDKFKSNVSYHKIAMIHGLTIGELAGMINGEGWLDGGAQCDLDVITVQNYDHSMPYELPIIPSPSLPNQLAVRLYMSLCLFEGTAISVGRGTDWPFQVLGYPNPIFGDFSFTPGTRPGMAAHVEQQGKRCYGLDLRGLAPHEQTFTLEYLIDFYQKAPFKDRFFARADFFDKLAGTDELRKQIMAGMGAEEIRSSWAADLNVYKAMRKNYLLYPDFE
ncbi:exo-beta-N-acetylmuramidase NamZ family protein [Parapedobacter koreensis]|uniref:Uncharacterized conserved protein YbbC, DUF1343 family n=1 Tax=Parapedobacter koreensis TaxID=332977 RepID=A0A1H7GQL6_9SPHI|nr:DUF1343 domain-containing protein [Parapedobacter koreensis]SEK40398.1 Uncharacterized conserved protein YbbC, DUF1343 family [Parapedobacter koreensis]